MYLCPRAHYAFHLSAGGALIHSVPSRLRPFPAAPALVPFFVPRHPPRRSSAPLLRVTLDFLVFRPLPACLSHLRGTGMPPGTQRRELKYIVILILLTPL